MILVSGSFWPIVKDINNWMSLSMTVAHPISGMAVLVLVFVTISGKLHRMKCVISRKI